MHRPNPGEVLVASVRHTGTHFLCRAIGDGVIRMHLDPRCRDEIVALSAAMQTFVPLRHPWLVAATWKEWGYPMPLLLECFQEIDTLTDPVFFPIESKPFDVLESRLKRDVNRDTSRIRHERSPDRS
jgi:hypothetical protein